MNKNFPANVAQALSNNFCVNMKISFLISGDAKVRVTILDNKITPKKLESMLESGKAVLTIQEHGNIEITRTGRVIGTVDEVDNNCTYEGFEVTKED